MKTLFFLCLLVNFFLPHPAMASANEGPETLFITLAEAQKLSDMTHDHAKASDTLFNLKEQRLISQQASREAEEIARLTYQSYTAGRSTFLEVQNANLKAMQANADTAKLEFEIINNISKIIYLASSQDPRKDAYALPQ